VIDEQFIGWQSVSRRHATLERDRERFIIVDLGSQNGVYINGQRTGENVLYDGWTVSFGQAQFVFRMNQPGGAA